MSRLEREGESMLPLGLKFAECGDKGDRVALTCSWSFAVLILSMLEVILLGVTDCRDGAWASELSRDSPRILLKA